jgi:hypothetical protein
VSGRLYLPLHNRTLPNLAYFSPEDGGSLLVPILQAILCHNEDHNNNIHRSKCFMVSFYVAISMYTLQCRMVGLVMYEVESI